MLDFGPYVPHTLRDKLGGGKDMGPEYLAGFFDGEGCIDVQRNYPKGREGCLYVRPRVRLALADSCKFILLDFQQRYGGHILHRAAVNSKQQSSTSWELLAKAEMGRMLQFMLPHLVIKKSQAELVLWWLENASGRYSGRGAGAGVPEARQYFVDELKRMKLDPLRASHVAVQHLSELLR